MHSRISDLVNLVIQLGNTATQNLTLPSQTKLNTHLRFERYIFINLTDLIKLFTSRFSEFASIHTIHTASVYVNALFFCLGGVERERGLKTRYRVRT